MGLFTQTKIKKVQLLFKDNHHFEFVTRFMEYSSLVVKEGEELVMGWKHFYATELPFPGYKKIHQGMVTLGFMRDVILDPFNAVPEGNAIGQKPSKAGDSIKMWIARIAENQRQTYRTKRKQQFVANKILWVEIFIAVLMAIVWAIRFSTM